MRKREQKEGKERRKEGRGRKKLRKKEGDREKETMKKWDDKSSVEISGIIALEALNSLIYFCVRLT